MTTIRDAVRTALIDLLNASQAHDTATPTTLAAIAATRRDLATLHRGTDPAGPYTAERDRHAALSAALGDVGRALLAHHPAEPHRLRAGLTVLAAIAVGWLDTLNTTPPDTNPPADDPDDGPVAEPF